MNGGSTWIPIDFTLKIMTYFIWYSLFHEDICVDIRFYQKANFSHLLIGFYSPHVPLTVKILYAVIKILGLKRKEHNHISQKWILFLRTSVNLKKVGEGYEIIVILNIGVACMSKSLIHALVNCKKSCENSFRKFWFFRSAQRHFWFWPPIENINFEKFQNYRRNLVNSSFDWKFYAEKH